MAGIDEVFERLVVDGDFRAALARDPHAALVEYDLTPAEVALLASRLDDGDRAQRLVEQRTSKSALLAALGMLDGDAEATDGVDADETPTVRGSKGPADEFTKVPAPPAPFVPVPYPNTAEAEVAIESLELSTEGIDVEAADAAMVKGPIKYGDITLKRGMTDDSGAAYGDDLEVVGDDVEVVGDDLAGSGDDVDVAGDDLAVPDGDAGDGPPEQDVAEEPEPDQLVQASEQAGDGQADVVTGAGPGAGPRSPEPDDDVFEITDADEAGGRGS